MSNIIINSIGILYVSVCVIATVLCGFVINKQVNVVNNLKDKK